MSPRRLFPSIPLRGVVAPLLAATPLLFMLSACQQAAWKAGANADDLKRDERTCRAQSPIEEAAVKQCLRAKGWIVTDFSAPADSDAIDNGTMASGTVENGSRLSAESKVVNSAKPASNTTASTTQNPLQRQSVQTWWKAGAQAADFNVDATICLAQLDPQHTPDYVKHLYTRAMVGCLRNRGWFAGSDPVYTPLR